MACRWGSRGPLRVKALVESITNSVQRTFGCQMNLTVRGATPEVWALPEAESIPVALTINELLTNAVKHSAGLARVHCTPGGGGCRGQGGDLQPGPVARGFSAQPFSGRRLGPGAGAGLLPRRSASFTLEQQGDEVWATVTLVPPGVTRTFPA